MTTIVFNAFLKEYKELCIKHGVHITAEMFDSLQVWPIGVDLEQIEPSNFEDWTSSSWLNSLKGKNGYGTPDT